MALSGEVEFEVVGDDCYYYAVVYAVCVFIFVLLLCLRSLCFRLFVYVFTCIHEQARAYTLLTLYLQTRNLDSPTKRGGL